MKLEDLDDELRLDLETAYGVLVDEGNSDDDIRAGLDTVLSTALPDSEVIDRRMVIDELMSSAATGDDADDESEDEEVVEEEEDEEESDDDDDGSDEEDGDEVPPAPAPVISTDDDLLMDILGAGFLKTLEDSGYRMEVERFDAKGATLFFDRDRSTRIIRLIDDIVRNADGSISTLLGDELTTTANILPGSIDSSIDLNKIRNQLLTSTAPEIEDNKVRRRIGQHLNHLTRVQTAQNNLSDVFGFDDPRELEAFFAAWLMKNSTCRLSGIPGTGKTTVINSAAIVMANSYGFSSEPRFYPRTANMEMEDPRTKIARIERVADPSRPRFAFPQGMSYDVSFSNRDLTDTLEAWDNWRFSDWNDNGYSGAYVYDFRFLRSVHDGRNKFGPLKAEDFARILFMHHIPVVKNPENHSIKSISNLINKMVRPITITVTGSGITIDSPEGGTENGIEYTYEISQPGGGDLIKRTLDHQRVRSHILSESEQDSDSVILRTDTGFSEGYELREHLMNIFYDSRIERINNDYSGDNLESLRSEMLREIGIAKIDNDKRADEILYGMEIQQVRETVEGRDVQTFVFDPIPRPIVTQPIKFFNEANRSQAGVEDAVLGLIAEREVEYRGKTFNSPAFVAWMDTNPHQKANDLAFTDRIDTELFFGTISLGSRNSQLQSRYAGAKNAKPDIQLITRIIEGEIDRPIRISELGLGSRSIWRFVDSIPFRPPEVTSGYDGLRDIATLSVLFTQRPQLRTSGDQFGITYDIENAPFIDYESTNPHASPLEDISRSSVPDIITGIDRERQIHMEADSFQPQSRITRVLGFRFTDSIVKMSRALAFLRGKTYVGRREIVDALPYCLGHRLGRARAEGDQEPTGIEQNAVISEQEYVRQILVHGYLLRDAVLPSDLNAGGSAATTGGGAAPGDQRPGAFEMWDAFFAYCSQTLASAVTYADFELRVLRPLQAAFIGVGSPGLSVDNLTTVHWHLASSVVENERNGITNMHPSHYSLVCTNGKTSEGQHDYTDVIAHYRKMISRPEKPAGTDTPAAMEFNFAAADYFRVRGRICSDRFLFSDDKAHLLNLVDSRIMSLCGRDSGVGGTSNPYAVAYASPGAPAPYTDSRPFPGYGPQPNRFPWRTYGDTAGAWGAVLGINQILGIGDNDPTQGLNLGQTDSQILFGLADQSHRIVFQCFEMDAAAFANSDERMKASDQEYRFRKIQSEEISSLFSQHAKDGVIFRKPGNEVIIPGTSDEGNSPAITAGIIAAMPDKSGVREGVKVNIINFMDVVNGLVESRMAGQGEPRNNASSLLSDGGLMACFPLKHAPGVVDRAGSTGAIPTIFDLMEQQDVESRFGDLRLWVSIYEADAPDNEGYTNMVFTMGITSNLARTSTVEETVVKDDGTDTTVAKEVLEYLDIREGYDVTADDIIDSGNLSGDDVIYYDRLFSRALNARESDSLD